MHLLIALVSLSDENNLVTNNPGYSDPWPNEKVTKESTLDDIIGFVRKEGTTRGRGTGRRTRSRGRGFSRGRGRRRFENQE